MTELGAHVTPDAEVVATHAATVDLATSHEPKVRTIDVGVMRHACMTAQTLHELADRLHALCDHDDCACQCHPDWESNVETIEGEVADAGL